MTRSWHVLLTSTVFLAFGLPAVAGGIGEPDPSTYASELPEVTRQYDRTTETTRYGDLFARYGDNKELPPGFELQALVALSHFPELSDIRIRFIVDDVGIPISSRPRPLSSLRSRRKRLYLVVIDTEMAAERDSLILANQPFNAQIGILGHELAHTAYYINRSSLGIIGDGLCQLIGSCRVNFERATDRRLVLHGLGWQRYDHSAFVRAGFAAAGYESDGAGGAYMDPPELLELMNESGMYM